MAVTPPQDPMSRQRRMKRREQQIRRRRMVLAGVVLLLIILIIVLALTCSGGDETTVSTDKTTDTSDAMETTTSSTPLITATYTANLTGAASVPPVETQSTGEFTMSYDPDTATLSFNLTLHGLSDPSVAAIYEGTSTTNGVAVYMLFAGPTKTSSSFEGVLASGQIDPSLLTGSLQGGTAADLISLIQSGNAYVSVGNTKHPIDAIRGTIN